MLRLREVMIFSCKLEVLEADLGRYMLTDDSFQDRAMSLIEPLHVSPMVPSRNGGCGTAGVGGLHSPWKRCRLVLWGRVSCAALRAN